MNRTPRLFQIVSHALICFLALLLFPMGAWANLNPASIEIIAYDYGQGKQIDPSALTQGDRFWAVVVVNGVNQLNAVDTVIAYSKDKLTVEKASGQPAVQVGELKDLVINQVLDESNGSYWFAAANFQPKDYEQAIILKIPFIITAIGDWEIGFAQLTEPHPVARSRENILLCDGGARFLDLTGVPIKPLNSSGQRNWWQGIEPEVGNLIPDEILQNASDTAIQTVGETTLGESSLPSSKPAVTFFDIKGHWAQKDIELMAAKDIATGVGDSSFAPDAKITRAEFATLLVKALGLAKVPASGKFADVSANAWYAGYVETAYQAGIVAGIGEGTFAPNMNITREQMAVMIVKAHNFSSGNSLTITTPINFVDSSMISSWAKKSVNQASAAGIIKGMTGNKFSPKSLATRAQGIVILKKLMENLNMN